MAASTQNLHFTYFGNNPEYLKRARLVEPEVFKQIDMLSNIGVTGVITGGFAAYITGYTKEYRDVDLFSADHQCTFASTHRTRKTRSPSPTNEWTSRTLHHGTADSLKSVALRANFKS
jgi:hypothetical protein